MTVIYTKEQLEQIMKCTKITKEMARKHIRNDSGIVIPIVFTDKPIEPSKYDLSKPLLNKILEIEK